MGINIAIDGPAGAGKSTIAKEVSRKLGFIYVDTGALYRAVAYQCLKNNCNTTLSAEVTPLLSDMKIELKFVDGSQRVILNDSDVSELIRTPEMSMGASNVSAIGSVRRFLFDLQREIAKENNVIMDGRDIGTVVLPNADVKIFLTASAEERANRRHLELSTKGCEDTYEKILEEIKIRDYNDSTREIAPLKQADDAILLDSTTLSQEEVVDKILEIINCEIKE